MKQWLGLVARVVVGGVWIWAAVIKLPHPGSSVEAVRAYELLPASLVEPIGYLLPSLELVVGLALVVGVFTRGAAVLSAVMQLAFIIGIASVWARGMEINCGCFGDGGASANASSQYPWEIARDTGLFAASIFVAWLGRTRLSLDGLLFRPLTSSADLDELEGFEDLDDEADGPDVYDEAPSNDDEGAPA